MSSVLKVRLSEVVEPGKTGHRFMPGNAHDGQMINTCPSHIGDGSMSEVSHETKNLYGQLSDMRT